MKKVLVWLMILAAVCSFAGCGGEKEVTLWVVTEETTWDRMNGQAWVLQKAFEESHPGVKINLDILPTGEQERSAYLQKLRTQIMQGRGPDGFLLPTDTMLLVGDAGKVTPVYIEPLFQDVALAMESGLFRDISRYYDADEALGKESLNTYVMDGGVADGKRYILPLRYDIPVIYAEKWTLEEKGFQTAVLEKTLPEIMAEAYKTGDPLVNAGAVYDGAGIFSDWIDYATGNVTVTEAELKAYMQAFQTQVAANDFYDRAYRLDVSSYIYGSYDASRENAAERFPLFIGSLRELLNYAPVAQYEGSDYAFLPLQAVGGGTVATVTYYAAVGAGSKNPQLTYEYLREFLTEESQWEKNRPTKINLVLGNPPSKTLQDKSTKSQQPGLIENGWPVRTKGSLNPVWNVRRIQFYSQYTDSVRMRKIGRSQLEEKYGEILEAPIREVRFPSEADRLLTEALRSLNGDYQQNYRPTEVAPGELAKSLLWEIRRHTAEG